MIPEETESQEKRAHRLVFNEQRASRAGALKKFNARKRLVRFNVERVGRADEIAATQVAAIYMHSRPVSATAKYEDANPQSQPSDIFTTHLPELTCHRSGVFIGFGLDTEVDAIVVSENDAACEKRDKEREDRGQRPPNLACHAPSPLPVIAFLHRTQRNTLLLLLERKVNIVKSYAGGGCGELNQEATSQL